MKTCGIVIEYNPMHWGHRHHIQEAKRITQADLIIGVMSPNFVQRGQPAIVSKFKRTQAALENGVDIICELPTFYALQSSQYFANKAVEILNEMKVSSLVFGSETNDLHTLQEIANLPINIDKFKEQMDLGYSYPQAINPYETQHAANDILGIGYLKALQKTTIKAVSIQRTNSYFDNQETTFFSAHDIRHHLDNPRYTKQSLTDLSEVVNMDKLFHLLQYKLISTSSKELSKYFLVNEGIQNLLKEKILTASNFDDFLAACTSKRYSKSRISRICMHILLNIVDYPVKNYKVRILGIKETALPYLKGLNIGTQVRHFDSSQIQAEIHATSIYALLSEEKDLLQQEISKLIIHP